ncbi:MAG: uncharacterized protein KVP18_000715 [Porospora cf. gigantea A]|uniref:uncharacterized protein n=1 Tax=Porospora cf. gigantea A TaxID=2853593 RepID=UPI0035593C17|nr:MAG: hypothetical protein KVP18_000715 [Porospora cf. gigantea A]
MSVCKASHDWAACCFCVPLAAFILVTGLLILFKGLFDVMIVCCLRKFPQFTSVIELLHTGWEISFGILLLYVLQKRCPHWANFCNIMGRMFLCFSLFVFTMDTMSRVASDVLIDDSTTPSPTNGPTEDHVLHHMPWSGIFPESVNNLEIGGLDDVTCGFGENEFRTLYAIWFTLYLITFLLMCFFFHSIVSLRYIYSQGGTGWERMTYQELKEERDMWADVASNCTSCA